MIGSSSHELLLWVGLVVVLLAALGLVMVYYRKRAVGGPSTEAMAMTVEQLERLLADGVISREEFRRLRRSVLGVPGSPAGDAVAAANKDAGPPAGAGAATEADSADPPEDEGEPPSALA